MTARTVFAERLYDRTPAAQAYRRSRLTPDGIRTHLTDWEARDAWGAQFAAIGLIEMARMLECRPAEFVDHVDRILDVLADVQGGAR